VLDVVEFIGEHVAIREFNAESDDRKIGRPLGLRELLPFQPLWALKIFEAHLFKHPRYGMLLADPALEVVPLTA